MNRLVGRVAIVTGASSGINRAIALGYAKEGATVVCADVVRKLRKGGFEADIDVPTDEVIRGFGAKATFVECDVSESEQVKALVAKAVDAYRHLDIIVNGAGYFSGIGGVHEMADSDFDRTMAVNAKGCWNGCKHAITQFLKQGTGGKIINIASVGGIIGLRGEPDYCASKGAIVNLTREVAIDYAQHNINVNAICPGAFPTAMARPAYDSPELNKLTAMAHPIGRWGRVEELVGPAVFLASDESSFVCGAILPVDGGCTAA
jgi:NAD(P)-dependent dehydrogenase (short-subunit alcohol dehydrogenase family)